VVRSNDYFENIPGKIKNFCQINLTDADDITVSLSRFGKGVIAAKLQAIKEEYGVIITQINSAYTSQVCSKCGYVDKNNRRRQAKFMQVLSF